MSAKMSALAQSASFLLFDENRSRRIAELLIVVWLLSLADLGFTLWAHFYTPFHELNPIARTMLEHNLIPTLIVFKLLLTAIGTLIFWRLRRHLHVEAAVWSMVAVYVLLTLRWSSYTVGTLAMAQAL